MKADRTVAVTSTDPAPVTMGAPHPERHGAGGNGRDHPRRVEQLVSLWANVVTFTAIGTCIIA